MISSNTSTFGALWIWLSGSLTSVVKREPIVCLWCNEHPREYNNQLCNCCLQLLSANKQLISRWLIIAVMFAHITPGLERIKFGLADNVIINFNFWRNYVGSWDTIFTPGQAKNTFNLKPIQLMNVYYNVEIVHRQLPCFN